MPLTSLRFILSASVVSVLFCAAPALAQPAAPASSPPAEGQPTPAGAQPAGEQPAAGQPPSGQIGQPMPGQPMPGQPMPGQSGAVPPPNGLGGQMPYDTPPPPPPPGAPGFAGPMMPWTLPPPRVQPERRPGVSRNGVPLTMRGQIGIDGGFFSAGDEDAAGASIDIVGGIPLTKHTFLDLRVPLAFGSNAFAVGNIDAGAHHVFSPTEGLWLSLGGGIGLPTLNEDTSSRSAYEIGSVTSAHWYFSEFWPNSVPIRASFGLEGHLGDLVTLRFFTNVVVMIGYEDNDEHELAIPHAVEVQFGHEFGGGLRVQGVALPTLDTAGQSTSFNGDLYQLALEPFFSYEGDVAFARAGIMMPLDGQLGPPFVQSWGFRLGTGVRLD